MKKKTIIIASISLLILCGIFVLIYYLNGNRTIPKTASDKVVFEGLNDAITEEDSYNSVKSKVAKVSTDDKPQLVIWVEDGFDGLAKPTDDMTEEEAEAIRKEQRRLVKEYHEKNSGDITKELKLDSMNITYEYGGYAPCITAEFKGQLTRKDIEDIYRIAKNPKVTQVVVQLNQVQENK